jgi:hypothetical protein
MSTATISIAFDDFARSFHGGIAREPMTALRLALLYGEQLRIPRSFERLRIVSGKSWVTFGGRDFTLLRGESLAISKAHGGAIISAVGGESLLFEVT